MRRFVIPVVVFVVIPVVVYYLLTKPYWDGIHLDTSVEAAARIGVGMKVADAERIIGGPSGMFQIDPDYQFRFGYDGYRCEVWTTDRGRIEVKYGNYTPLRPPDPNRPMLPKKIVPKKSFGTRHGLSRANRTTGSWSTPRCCSCCREPPSAFGGR